jgi:hypothetical protein
MTKEKPKTPRKTPKKKAPPPKKKKMLSPKEINELHEKKGLLRNTNAQIYSPEDIERLAAKIRLLSKTERTMAGIALGCDMSYTNLWDMGQRYRSVSDAIDLAQTGIVKMAMEQGLDAKGFPNMLQQMVKVHGKPIRDMESKIEVDNFKAKEDHKAAIRAKERLELVEEVASMSPAQALAVKQLVEKRLAENE